VTTNASGRGRQEVSRSELVELLRQDLSRKYHAYLDCSQVLKSAESSRSPIELEELIAREIQHATILARQIDTLCSIRLIRPKPSQRSTRRVKDLPIPLGWEPVAFQDYRDRIRQCERLGEYEVAGEIRCILIDEQKQWTAQAANRKRFVLSQRIAS